MRLLNFHRNKDFSGGFTLIELLLVIAIIGILSSVIITSMRSARDKGRNARVKTSLNQVRVQAILISNLNYSFESLCDGNTLNYVGYPETLGVLKADIERYKGIGDLICYATINTYCVQSPLASGGAYCLDHTGYLGQNANCDLGNIQCAAP